ncbi:MAG: helix-turn-helix transcriptional regulator [Acidimicrobiales bacterium]
MSRAGSVLSRVRREAALTQSELAAAAMVRQPLVSRIERGRERPSVETLARLVRACGYELVLEFEPLPDPHDLSLLEANLRLSPEQRIDRLVTLRRTADQLRDAASATGSRRDA